MKRVGFVKRRFVSSALVRAPQSSHSHLKTSKPLFIVFCRTFQYFLHKNTATVGIASPLSKHHLLLYPDQISMQDGMNMIHRIWLGLYCIRTQYCRSLSVFGYVLIEKERCYAFLFIKFDAHVVILYCFTQRVSPPPPSIQCCLCWPFCRRSWFSPIVMGLHFIYRFLHVVRTIPFALPINIRTIMPAVFARHCKPDICKATLRMERLGSSTILLYHHNYFF